MKTKWGSCTPAAKSIRLNTELAKKSPKYLKYIIVHEMAHLLEATHSNRFYSLMDQFMPEWRQLRDGLNRLALHLDKEYLEPPLRLQKSASTALLGICLLNICANLTALDSYQWNTPHQSSSRLRKFGWITYFPKIK